MATAETQRISNEATLAAPAASAPAAGGKPSGVSFRDLLSMINPLQYLPVVGTIYRAVTGDTISEPVREAGSLLVSGLLGGPIGVVTSAATSVAERVTGIDPEKILAARLHAASPPAPAGPAAANPAAERGAPPPVDPAAASAGRVLADRVPASAAPPAAAVEPVADTGGWTLQQLAAYGVRSDASGTLKLGDLLGADVLNAVELVRLDQAVAAYAANQTPPTTRAPATAPSAASGVAT